MLKLINTASYKYIVIIIIFFGFLLGLRWAWSEYFSISEYPQVVDGVLDLRDLDHLEKSSIVSLNGQWKLYPQELNLSHDIQSKEEQFRNIQVPGDWGNELNKDYSYGYGTYRLRILIDPLKQPVAFWIQGIQASSEIEINGVVSAGSGIPASHANEYTPKNVSYTALYSIEGTTEIELLIHVANFDDPNDGGITRPILFGTQEAIDKMRWCSILFQLVTFIILMLHGLYACILYLLNPKDRALLIMSLLTLTVGILIVSRYDHLLLEWFPINYSWVVKIRLVSYLWQNFFILLIFRRLSSVSSPNVWLRLYTVALYTMTGVLLLAHSSFVNGVFDSKIFIAFSMIPYIWLFYIIGTMIFKKQSDNDVIFLLIAAASLISNFSWNIFGSVTVYYPIDIIATFIGFSTYWFKKYSRNSMENEILNEQLKKSDKLKDQFLTNTSHELRTPLHGIMNIAQAIVTKESVKMNKKSVKDMELLISISCRMSYMIEDLLDVARLKDHRIVLQQEPLQIQSIIPGVLAMLKFMTEGKSIQFHINIAESFPPVMADEKRLVQILYNLLHNAFKYTEEGTISVSTESQAGYAIIHITDTGIGMNEQTQARVFLPYELGTYGVSDGKGIGLGLSICKQLIELHGGTLKVRSELGKGTIFSFDLPLSSVANLPLSQQSNQPHHIMDGSEVAVSKLFYPALVEDEESLLIPPLINEVKANILIVDDNTVNLKVLVSILSTEQYNITAAHSAHEVLALLGTQQWDLLIADAMMPHISGYELTQRVREHYSVSELPILLLTARSQPADIYTGFSSGANDYVTKPVDALELRYRISALITLKQSINQRLRMEAAYLQAQIHPHFLFNTLNSMMALSDIDTEKMRTLGESFASFLRISFNFLNTGELVELSHELELVESYLYIEKVRFEERLSIVWEVESNISLLLPPLSLQPLIENAVKHGLNSQNKGVTVHIRVIRQDNSTLIEVSDNGIGMNQKEVNQLLIPSMKGKGGIGLSNTNRRLIQMYGQGLSIFSKPNEGTTVSFIIPDNL